MHQPSPAHDAGRVESARPRCIPRLCPPCWASVRSSTRPCSLPAHVPSVFCERATASQHRPEHRLPVTTALLASPAWIRSLACPGRRHDPSHGQVHLVPLSCPRLHLLRIRTLACPVAPGSPRRALSIVKARDRSQCRPGLPTTAQLVDHPRMRPARSIARGRRQTRTPAIGTLLRLQVSSRPGEASRLSEPHQLAAPALARQELWLSIQDSRGGSRSGTPNATRICPALFMFLFHLSWTSHADEGRFMTSAAF